MRLKFPVAVAAACLLAVSACAGAPDDDTASTKKSDDFPVKVSGCGFTSTVEAKPKRAITLNQGATEVALALGVQDQLRGTAYLDNPIAPKYEKAYKSVPVLSKQYLSHEKLLAEKPDFVYASYASAYEDKASGSQSSLAKVGIASYLSPLGCKQIRKSAVHWTDIWGEVTTAGKAFGVRDRAKQLVRQQDAMIKDVHAAGNGRGLKVFWFDSSGKTAFAGAGQGGPQLVLNAVGATNAFKNLAGEWAEVSWEQVIKADPDVILLNDATWSPAAQKKKQLESDPATKNLDAVRHHRYAVLPFSEGTPGVGLADGAASLSRQLAKYRD